ncbi:flavodoxin [Lactobacillus sp. S2-2]|uniref:flavodoxin n=1 Tax=Lactobacillus sp. S2-2 TaxID=2692917 RepID=UPI001F2C8841|nr:flavodoxin [Lactobacillus sp. S2-2]MCF6514822.1 flavodoxin [Lactobacillus sp. S2-2]
MSKAHVVFATITGNNEDVADIVTEGLEDQGLEVIQSEISQTEPEELLDADIIVFCIYTYNEGHLPEEGEDFYNDMQELDLSSQIYGVAGSGDVFYEEFYNTAVDDFSNALKKAGAIKGSNEIKINLEPDQEDIEKLDEMTANLAKALTTKR